MCLSVLSEDNRILMWDIRRATGPVATFDQHNGANRSVSSSSKAKVEECTRVCTCMYGGHVASSGCGSITSTSTNVRVLASMRAYMCTREGDKRQSPSHIPPVVTAHSGVVTGLRYTHDGLFVVSCGSDDRVKLWDGATGQNTMVCVCVQSNMCRVTKVTEVVVLGDPCLFPRRHVYRTDWHAMKLHDNVVSVFVE